MTPRADRRSFKSVTKRTPCNTVGIRGAYGNMKILRNSNLAARSHLVRKKISVSRKDYIDRHGIFGNVFDCSRHLGVPIGLRLVLMSLWKTR